MYDWYDEYEKHNKKMDSKSKHPFNITCRRCGSNRIMVVAAEYLDLVIKCMDCEKEINCGTYYTYQGDYSGM